MSNRTLEKQKIVAIVQRILPHYRVPMFVALRERLLREGIQLRLIYGQEYSGMVPRTVDFHADWAVRIDNHYVQLCGLELVWQPCRAYLVDADLVIVEQANRLLINYLLMIRGFRDKDHQLAIFGHGRNMQAPGKNLRERMKRHMLGAVDWCFVYTQASAEAVIAGGISTEQVTIVNNTINTEVMSEALAVLAGRGRVTVRSELGLGGGPVALYCGGLSRGKRLDFLIEACAAIQRRLPDFILLVIGDGPNRDLILEAAQCHPWARYVGPLFGVDRAPYMMASDVQLMPGQVGLAVVDSFVAETPIFTTDIPVHGPEIVYLENGINGVMTANSVDAYAGAVIEYFGCAALRDRLKEGCRLSAQQYSMEQMVERFSKGIALSLSGGRREQNVQPTRVAILTNRIPDYRRPVFEALHHDPSLSLRILLTQGDKGTVSTDGDALPISHTRSINLPWTTIHSTVATRQQEYLSIPLMQHFELAGFRPDLIISGEFGLRSLLSWFTARLYRVPFALWSEETSSTARDKRGLRLVVRRFLIPRANAFLVLGRPAADYLTSWGVPNSRIYMGAQAVDNGFWSEESGKSDRGRIRREMGLKGTTFVAVGRLVALKGFDLLLNAWADLPNDLQARHTLLIIGDGDERGRLEAQAARLRIARVIFWGHKSPVELAGIYAAADVAVLPSLVDVWGLVVNEAMASGLPALVSRYAGAGPGLVEGSGAGEVFDPLDKQAFTELLARWCDTAGTISRATPEAAVAQVTFDVTISAIKRLVTDHARESAKS